MIADETCNHRNPKPKQSLQMIARLVACWLPLASLCTALSTDALDHSIPLHANLSQSFREQAVARAKSAATHHGRLMTENGCVASSRETWVPGALVETVSLAVELCSSVSWLGIVFSAVKVACDQAKQINGLIALIDTPEAEKDFAVVLSCASFPRTEEIRAANANIPSVLALLRSNGWDIDDPAGRPVFTSPTEVAAFYMSAVEANPCATNQWILGIYNDDGEIDVLQQMNSFVSNKVAAAGTRVVMTTSRSEELSSSRTLQDFWKSKQGYMIYSPTHQQATQPPSTRIVLCEVNTSGGVRAALSTTSLFFVVVSTLSF